MVTSIHTGSLSGIEAVGVAVEVSQARGLPGFDIVGLPEAALRESRVRVMAALTHSGYQLPDRHFIINLAPAELRKSGASFDLAIAIGLLAACGMCATAVLEHTLLLGELSLDGRLRPVRGVLAQLRSARRRQLQAAIIPVADAGWAALLPELRVYGADHLQAVVAFLEGVGQLELAAASGEADAPLPTPTGEALDLGDVCGQAAAKRALEIAAAGGHNLLLIGPPGAGKSMLASRMPSILPVPDAQEALEIATIASAAGLDCGPACGFTRPFRAPHHSCSEAALIGGGHPIRPGEVTLAHGGVLFLDELPEFRRNAIEALRPTMESGLAVVVRARERVCMPARPLVVAAMNPCPCGYAGDPKRLCRCSFEQAQRYRSRVSGPVIDRFDLHVQLPPVPVSALQLSAASECSASVRDRVARARACAQARAGSESNSANPAERMRALDRPARELLVRSVDMLGLSLRACTKVLKIARSIADLDGCDAIASRHVGEAIQYRLLDRAPQALPATANTRVAPAEPRSS